MLYASAFLIDPCLLLSFSVSILRIHFIGVLITVQLPGGRMRILRHGLSLLGRKPLPAQVWTRAIPVGVTVRRAIELIGAIIINGNYSLQISILFLN
ncbi:hypothetical protein GCM10007971_03660 [Oceanobacillus indicireducens]|uniref:Uncharacterized protein n=1 Tax=Oceanobacillus indicireducens TaxID=1004261 RepID=A0A918CYP6_9BACI|nr:hypothetical protein GCM10007971_03660 [Oceanobacillus indicireducens]